MHSNHNWILINLFWVSWCGGCHSAKTQLVSFVLMLCFVKAGTPTPVKTLLETVNLNLFRHKLHYIWKKQKKQVMFSFSLSVLHVVYLSVRFVTHGLCSFPLRYMTEGDFWPKHKWKQQCKSTSEGAVQMLTTASEGLLRIE